MAEQIRKPESTKLDDLKRATHTSASTCKAYVKCPTCFGFGEITENAAKHHKGFVQAAVENIKKLAAITRKANSDEFVKALGDAIADWNNDWEVAGVVREFLGIETIGKNQ